MGKETGEYVSVVAMGEGIRGHCECVCVGDEMVR